VSGRYLTDLAGVLERAGQSVVELDGWQTRARSSGGYADGGPWCLMVHHTASAGDGAADAHYCTFGSPDRPVCNLVLGRDAVWHVCAAGATNTNGKGGPWRLADGRTVAQDQMNLRALAVECSNNGVGQVWPQVQMDALFAGLAALSAAYLGRQDLLCQHVDWAPGRKIDPATAAAVQGPWRPGSINGSGSWRLGDLIAENCRRAASSPAAPIPPPTPDPEDDDMTTWLVIHPRTGEYLTTDLATFATYCGSPNVAGEGRDLFGWRAMPDGSPWGLGPEWGDYLDQLPRVTP
jgi:hypothetical protein